MEFENKKIVVIGGAGLIGSHTVDELLKEDLKEIVIFDNFVRGSNENIENAIRDPRVSIFKAGGDILQTDILNAALDGADEYSILPLCGCYIVMIFLEVLSKQISKEHLM